jgi:hypothetical protein
LPNGQRVRLHLTSNGVSQNPRLPPAEACGRGTATKKWLCISYLRWLICGMSWITVPTATSFYESLACFVSWLRMARSLSYFNLYRG